MKTTLSWRRIAWLAALAVAALLAALWLRWGETIFAGQLGAMLC
ncbi:hypothetical protein DFR29_11275 [Tahibacter aquaticus]|uniref:Uncharacterized protein n=1 Tax=Tahibacter aquaticus TaxID=520092 RepID=A0A4R6YRK8_9GAMM|nr:hypothetical protein [Tahibacter aquaticus]TDR40761.1 hypothetical protein DFR29_11275 [Tahibacter aquaticus]